MSEEDQELLKGADIPQPIDSETAREFAAAAGVKRSWTRESAINPGTVRYFEEIGGGLRQDSATEEPPYKPRSARQLQPAHSHTVPRANSGSDGFIFDSDLDPEWAGAYGEPPTKEEQDRAAEQLPKLQAADIKRRIARIEAAETDPVRQAALTRHFRDQLAELENQVK